MQSKEERAEYMRLYRQRRKASGKPIRENYNAEVQRHWDWWKKYRLRPDDVKALWQSQGCQCAICKVDLPQPGTYLHTHIDHCHATGRVRGIICRHCNLMLGHAKDNPDTLRAAVEYLRVGNSVP